ncbi:MAG TPA: acetylxylan esterase [Mucilaginibacter sp.]|nr:acetylxylan esterase [Mucilaginibacter sp.]
MKVFLVMTLLSGLLFAQKAQAGGNVKNAKADGEVTTDLVIHDSNAIFNGTASFTFSVKNTLDTDQVGTVSYLLMTEKGVKLGTKVVKVKIDRNTNESYDFDIPNLKAGFYKIDFMINVSDYDDTTRRAFGIRPEEIRSQYPKPADFDQFWQKAKDDLAKVKPEFKVKEYPDSTKDNRRVFGFEMKSLDNMTIRGWLTIPKTNNTHKKFAVLLGLPGYQVGLPPMFGSDVDLAIITLNVRGQGNSTDVIKRPRDEFLFYNLDNKDKYVMRGVIMDCVRAVDFIFSRPELRHDNIMVSGGSMGGFLAVATAALDKRVTLCSAQNPILCDVHNLVGEVEWPVEDLKKYVRTVPGLTLEKALDNLDYFDVKNFATDVICPTLMGIGVLDPLAPPANEYAAYNNITAKKHIIIFKDLGHEVAVRYKNYEGRWMRDTFGLF